MSQATTSGRQSTAPDDIAELAGSFARHLRSENKRPATITSYLDAVRLLDEYLKDRGMPRQVANVHREHVESFIEDQLARLRPASAANRFRSLQAWFKWLYADEQIPANPMAKMTPPKVPPVLIPVIETADLERLFRGCSGKDFDSRRDRAILSLLVDTGIRRSELSGLQVGDVNLPTHRRGDATIGGQLRVVGKGDKERMVAIGAKASDDLDSYLRVRRHHPRARETALFLGLKGALTDSGVAQMVERRGQAAGVPNLHLHRFRHSFASSWLEAGGSEGDLMALAGWTSRTMLMRYGRSEAARRALKAHERFSPRNKL